MAAASVAFQFEIVVSFCNAALRRKPRCHLGDLGTFMARLATLLQ